ncbi:MAG: DUF1599 domain-containing protein [Clostridiales bacterium]|nr:DUF1599 domain-containing protein [Clostridiales bacterium]
MLKPIALDVVELVEKKDHDYNHAFRKSYEEYGMAAYCIRIQDKINRVKALGIDKKEQQVDNESIKDTVTDIMGYSLLMLCILEAEEEEAMLRMERDYE